MALATLMARWIAVERSSVTEVHAAVTEVDAPDLVRSPSRRSSPTPSVCGIGKRRFHRTPTRFRRRYLAVPAGVGLEAHSGSGAGSVELDARGPPCCEHRRDIH
jgi:hypothetical protein